MAAQLERDPATSHAVFEAVLAGATYAEAGARAGLSPSTVENRVRRMALTLQTEVGVEDVDDNAWPTLHEMRERRDQYLEALSHYDPSKLLPERDRPVPADADIEVLLGRVVRHSRSPKRDVAITLVLFTTALKPAELARLEIRDYLSEDGGVRTESELRAEAAANGRARALYFIHERVHRALDDYLVERGARDGSPWRGLPPTARLLVVGRDASLGSSGRGGDRPDRQAMYDVLHRIFRLNGSPGLSALGARRYAAAKLSQHGLTVQQIAETLGLQNKAAVKNLLPRTPPSVRAGIGTLLGAP